MSGLDVIEAKLDALTEKVDANHADTGARIDAVNDTLTLHNGRLRKVEKEQIREDAKAEVRDKVSKVVWPVVTSVVSALIVIGFTWLVTGGPA